MKLSLRTYLLVNLLASVIFITSLTVGAHILLNRKNTTQYVDKQLALMAIATHISLERNISSLNNEITKNSKNDSCQILTKSEYAEEKGYVLDLNSMNLCHRIRVQIWDSDGLLIFPSPSELGNSQLFAYLPGFSTQKIAGTAWRVFTSQSSKGYRVAIAEDYNFYQESERQISTHAILIMLLALPLLTMLIWIIVGKGLTSIQNIVNEIKNRAPGNLLPVISGTVPVEIQPIVKELNILLKKLEEAFLREERFSSDAAHELRTPLAALRAHVHVALKATTSKERNTALNKIITGIDRSTHVVNQLLTLARATKVKDQPKLEPTSLHQEAVAIISELFPIAQKKGIAIELIDHYPKQLILGDKITIGVLLKNLIDNSIRYINHNKGLIQVIIERNKESVILKVRDNGPGIPSNTRKHIFERFFRGAETANIQGSGLGLNIVQQVIKQHRATVTLSKPKGGPGLEIAVFFKLPEKK